MTLPDRYYKELYALLCAMENAKEAKLLLQDLLTPQELDSLAERWQEVRALAKGATQRSIAKRLGISISKITRGSRVLKNGSGGFGYFLRKLRKPVRE